MVIGDEELRRRLKARNYPVPPITDTTRHVLLKKLQQLEDEQSCGGAEESLATRGGMLRKPLFDYSSAEDEEGGGGGGSVSRNEPLKKKGSTLRRRVIYTNGGSVPPVAAPVSKSYKTLINGYHDKGKSLLSHSETEEEDSEEDQHSLALYGKQPQEDEEEEDDEEEEEEEEEEEDEEDQSPTSTSGNRSSSPYLKRTPLMRDRFASSTPLNSVRSTASYLVDSDSSSPRLKPEFSSLSSPTLRKQIASNKESFGEALSSLPQNSGSNSLSTNMRPMLFSNGGTNSVLTQAAAPLSHLQKEFKTKRSSFCNSHTISKIIVVLAGIFFSGIAFKYSNLRPSPNIQNRIVICEKPSFPENCVNVEDAEKFIHMHRDVVDILEKKGVEIMCGGDEDYSSPPFTSHEDQVSFKGNATFSYSIQELYMDLKSNTDYKTLDHGCFSRFIHLLAQNPQWGVLVSSSKNEISLYNPPINWSCWLSLKIGLTYSFLCSVLSWILKGIIVLSICYGLYRWRLWSQERKLRENQDVFELVEHVLSILATQNTLVLREGRGSTSSPCIAINHIRDQLISPQDRDKKKKLWDKVVNYIRKSESRVREDAQKIYGEEVKVWQWIPDIRWGNSSLNQHGPNPYVPGVAATTTPPPPQHSPPPSMPSSSAHLTPSPQWQGSAFSSLNKNVAAPQVAPTSCLKVRHMFDRTIMQSSPTQWVWKVKEEILRRCSGSANIIHIAVDKQSPEGCVYIKTSNTEGAGAVFRCLHGQWYRGNLVTVKYLREERYQERFPDSPLARNQLLSQK